MINKNIHNNPNIAMLEFVARKLGDIKEELVFVGGCTTALLVTEPIPGIRPTDDVDCIVDVISLKDYYRLEKQLAQKGFKKSLNEQVICRWYYDDIILDVMPTDKKILSFGNPWYKAAIRSAVVHEISENLFIKAVSAPYFLATKLEAFKDRGNNDFLSSHDFEDIITVIDGRTVIVNDIAMADEKVRSYLVAAFSAFLANESFRLSLAGHLNYYGPTTQQRVFVVLDRLKQIAKLYEG
ncbi:MAG: hypothetical protein K0Q57_103 [Gammaproteobacteria bacterium]|jgi:hypothetical protein|nr:hypothetical protein [Gammaproteobacteria bacterium]